MKGSPSYVDFGWSSLDEGDIRLTYNGFSMVRGYYVSFNRGGGGQCHHYLTGGSGILSEVGREHTFHGVLSEPLMYVPSTAYCRNR